MYDHHIQPYPYPTNGVMYPNPAGEEEIASLRHPRAERSGRAAVADVLPDAPRLRARERRGRAVGGLWVGQEERRIEWQRRRLHQPTAQHARALRVASREERRAGPVGGQGVFLGEGAHDRLPANGV